tara:strand:+ start:385 stop:588 length:204 start_codon:yes stop_codon:yes gene_type:complete
MRLWSIGFTSNQFPFREPYESWGHLRFIHLKITLEMTMEKSRKTIEIQMGASSLVAIKYVVTSIPAP